MTFMVLVDADLLTNISAYHLETSTASYIYQDDLPHLAELTLCFWLQLLDTDADGLGAESLFTIATRKIHNRIC